MEDEGKAAFCKCDDDWTCTITKNTDPSKSFANCSGGPCSCSIKATDEPLSEEELKQAREGSPPANSKVFCVCPEGWSCVVSNTAGKVQFECGEGCACVVGENDAVKIAHV